jgi:hypothetical protein
MTARFKIAFFGLGLALCIGGAAVAAELMSPDAVKNDLRLMMQVTNDFKRQIDRKNYARLPAENGEFTEAVAALRATIGNEPADFRSKADAAIDKAVAASKAVADLSSSNDEAKLRAAQDVQVKAVNAVFVLFPENLRPDPNVAPGRGGR